MNMPINPYEPPRSQSEPKEQARIPFTALRLLALMGALAAVFALQVATFHLLYWLRRMRMHGSLASFLVSDELLFFICPALVVLLYVAVFRLLVSYRGMSAWGLVLLASGGMMVVGEVISMMFAFTRWGT